MTWNYRVVRREGMFGPEFEIHEAYYSSRKDTVPKMISENGISPFAESIKGLKKDLKFMLAALDQPVIDWDEWRREIENTEMDEDEDKRTSSQE